MADDRYWQFTLHLDNGAVMTFGIHAPHRESAVRTALIRSGRAYFRAASARLDEIPALEDRLAHRPA
jgi:hypothetical protein